MGRNNVNDVGMQDTVMADIASAVANLSHSRFLVLTVLNSKTETTGTANYNAIIALNNAILAAYPNNSYDMRSHLATDPDGTIPSGMMSDVIHLNATGYAEVAAQVSAFLSGKGW
jgi:lysophospholipase L1-like esterase